MTDEDRIKDLKNSVETLQKLQEAMNSSLDTTLLKLSRSEKALAEMKDIYETLSQTVSSAVGDMQEQHHNTLNHFMNSLNNKVATLVKDQVAESLNNGG